METKSSMRLPVMTETGRPDMTEPGLAITCRGTGMMGGWGQLPIITTGLITFTWELQIGAARVSLEGEHEGLLTVQAMIFVSHLSHYTRIRSLSGLYNCYKYSSRFRTQTDQSMLT